MSASLRPRIAAVATGAVLATAALAGCSSSGDGEASEPAADSAAGATARESAPRPGRADALSDGSAFAANRSVAQDAPGEAEPAGREDGTGQQPMVIRTGTVSLRSADVGAARFDVQKVVDRAGGEITEEETHTGDDGEVSDSRLVLRIPSERFEETMEGLEGIAELETSTTDSEDVTTEVIDNRVRIRVQRASIRRIEALLSRAQDIGTIVRIEAQLTRRQSTLNSLLRRQAYLADQTSLATITVHLERIPSGQEPEDEDDAAGFLAGLESGWHALAVFGVGVATVVGAVLPWLPVALLLGVPLWLLLRRRRRPAPAEPAPAEG